MTPASGQQPGRRVSRIVLFAGLAVGTFVTVTAYAGGYRPPASGLAAVLAGIITWLLAVAAAAAILEMLRRHHRVLGRRAWRYSRSGARRATAWLAARAGPRWENREHQPLMFRRLRGEPESLPAEQEPGPAGGATYSWGSADSPYGWPADDLETATSRARHASTSGKPYVVTEYPPGGGPGTTVATYLNGQPSTEATEGNTAMPASRIPPERRARRAAARTGGSMPAEWGPVIAQTADFEPENDGELLDWMTRQVTGLSGWAEALVDFYEHCTQVIGIDPAASAMLHDVADAAARAAETMGAAKAKFTEHYELPREFAGNGGLMTHDGRWITGDGA
jgi:hypothetical protein